MRLMENRDRDKYDGIVTIEWALVADGKYQARR